MKVDGPIAGILGRRVHNEHDYYHRVIYPLLDQLGFPSHDDDTARWPQFPIKNPTGDGWLKLDYLSAVGSLPMLIIEGKERVTLFRDGLRQASTYARNFEPKPESGIRKMTVPFLLVAAGEHAEMFRAVARGIDVMYEPIRLAGQPAFLEWGELLREAERYRELPDVELPAAQPAGGAPITEQELLKAEFAEQFFDDLYTAIFEAAVLQKHDDRRLVLFSQIVQTARSGDGAGVTALCEDAGLSKKTTAKVHEALSWYADKFTARELEGPAVARAFRDFITSDQTRKGLKLFTGNSQQINLPKHLRRLDRNGKPSRNTGRYFTPTDIAHQMVRLADIRDTDRVIDPFCGSGIFPAEVAMVVSQQGDAEAFVREGLVGIDEDPFCVQATRTLLGLLFPRCQNQLKVFLHNCLYADAPKSGEYKEDPAARDYLRPGSYDVVIGNPPGNKRYSGSNAAHVAALWAQRYRQSTKLWDHVFFVRRAVELAKPDGGRICILVPDGFLANSQFDYLRREVLAQCELHTVISLPRVFKNNEAKMSLLYMIRTGEWDREQGTVAPWSPDRRVLMASIPEKVEEPDLGSNIEEATHEVPSNVYAELEQLVDHYREAETGNPRSGAGPGLNAFPVILDSLTRPAEEEDDEEDDNAAEEAETATAPSTTTPDARSPGVTTGRASIADHSRDELIEALCAVLEGGELEREEAIRRAARLLQERSGLAFSRLRRNGPIWNAFKSAINAGIRRGVLSGTLKTVRSGRGWAGASSTG